MARRVRFFELKELITTKSFFFNNGPGPRLGPKGFLNLHAFFSVEVWIGEHACIFFGRLASDACMHFLDWWQSAKKFMHAFFTTENYEPPNGGKTTFASVGRKIKSPVGKL